MLATLTSPAVIVPAMATLSWNVTAVVTLLISKLVKLPSVPVTSPVTRLLEFSVPLIVTLPPKTILLVTLLIETLPAVMFVALRSLVLMMLPVSVPDTSAF